MNHNCPDCRSVGMLHCSDPVNCGGMTAECDHCEGRFAISEMELVRPVYPGAKEYYLCAECAEATQP